MTRASVQKLVKGDIIIERVGDKNRMTPVRQVEFNACSSNGVHVNRSVCYDFNAVVNLVESEGTLEDLEKEFTGLGDIPDDFPTEKDLQDAYLDSLEAWMYRFIKM